MEIFATQSNPITLSLYAWLKKNWFKTLVSFVILMLCFSRDVSIQFNVADRNQAVNGKLSALPGVNQVVPESSSEKKTATTNTEKVEQPAKKPKKWDSRKANDFYNITFILNPDYGERKGIDPAIVEEKLFNCQKYVSRFSKVAVNEMRKYGIPASITLAQGLLESDAGGSRLSVESNNHFGIKCRSKCKGCTCRNYTDDDIYDMFRVFDSAWESYREHSILLSGGRYRHLKKLGTGNYKSWAHGLKKAGYATDKRYAEKLIKIIEEMKLYQYDG